MTVPDRPYLAPLVREITVRHRTFRSPVIRDNTYGTAKPVNAEDLENVVGIYSIEEFLRLRHPSAREFGKNKKAYVLNSHAHDSHAHSHAQGSHAHSHAHGSHAHQHFEHLTAVPEGARSAIWFKDGSAFFSSHELEPFRAHLRGMLRSLEDKTRVDELVRQPVPVTLKIARHDVLYRYSPAGRKILQENRSYEEPATIDLRQVKGVLALDGYEKWGGYNERTIKLDGVRQTFVLFEEHRYGGWDRLKRKLEVWQPERPAHDEHAHHEHGGPEQNISFILMKDGKRFAVKQQTEALRAAFHKTADAALGPERVDHLFDYCRCKVKAAAATPG